MAGSSTHHRPRTGSGEPLVWLTGMGLVLGLAMITGLLAIILVNGVKAFWPPRIARLALTDAGRETFKTEFIEGAILSLEEKRTGPLDEKGRRALEYKVQVGSKDLLGNGFLYIDASEVTSISHPADIVRLERTEYGPAFARLVAIGRAGAEGEAPRDSGVALLPALRELVAQGNARRAEIERIEKDEIGAINSSMQELRREKRRLERAAGGGAVPAAALAGIEARTADLQASYETLAAEARTLRARQGEQTLTYVIFNGREKTIPVSDVVAASTPNTLSTIQRVGVFLANVWAFVSEDPREANTEGGIFPAIFGTFVMTLILSVAVTPFGVIAAIYLREYARDGPLVRAVRIAINNLAGVPSIVFGVFGLGFFVYVLGGGIDRLFYPDNEGPVFGTGGILWASLTLALMTVPVVIVATEESLAAVSRGVREGSLACGASKWQTIQRVVLPAAAPGIITGMILAMARGAGEVAPLMITGVVKLAPTLPMDTTFPFLHLDRKFMHLGFHIYDVGFQSPDSDAARPMVFATTLLLIILVVSMNLGAIVIRERLRRKYATGAF
ncbi:MAG: phosphate ABC transporter permease PstA [Phycisphaerales bacterium]